MVAEQVMPAELARRILLADIRKVLSERVYVGFVADNPPESIPITPQEISRLELAEELLAVFSIPFSVVADFIEHGFPWPINEDAYGMLYDLWYESDEPDEPDEQEPEQETQPKDPGHNFAEDAKTEQIETLIRGGEKDSAIARHVSRSRQRVHQVRQELRRRGEPV